MGLVKAEFRKLTTTQVWFWLLLASIAVTALLVIVQLATRPDPDIQNNVTDIFTAGQTAYIGSFVLGILSVTTEFRYQTITPTFLATPSRWALITAKLLTYALVGALYAVACVATTVVIAVPWLSSKGIQYSWGSDHVARALIAIFVIVILYALLGLGVGAFLRNQIVAVTVGVLYLLIIENLLSVIPYVRSAYPYLPGGGAAAIIRSHASYGPQGTYHVFATAGGVAVLVVWALVLSLAGAGLTMNRDIT